MAGLNMTVRIEDPPASSRWVSRRRVTSGFFSSYRQWPWLFVILLLIPLRCARPANAAADYNHAFQIFLHGNLATSQHEAEAGLRHYQYLHPEWLPDFQLLVAEDMIWRGLNKDAKDLLSRRPEIFTKPEHIIRKLTLQGIALAHLQEFAAADQKLADAGALCRTTQLAICHSLPRAHGLVSLEQGNFTLAHQLFSTSLQLGQTHRDPWLEATSLLYLGVVANQSGHFDEAVQWSQSANNIAAKLGAQEIAQVALGNLGWTYVGLGDSERALKLFLEAQNAAQSLDDIRADLMWRAATGYVYAKTDRIAQAREAYDQALKLAYRSGNQEDIGSILSDLGLAALASNSPAEADHFAQQSLALAQKAGSRPDMFDAIAIQMQAAAQRGDEPHARELLNQVEAAPESGISMRWACQRAMANLDESRHDFTGAEAHFQSALNLFESARGQLQHEDSQLPFLANATGIYDDYVDFLITQGKIEQALITADQSRARTLAQGLDASPFSPPLRTTAINPEAIARKSGSTLLFYWLGQKHSYLWTITPAGTTLRTLPPQRTISTLVNRYRTSLLGPDDPLQSTDQTSADLYSTLIAPASDLIDTRRQIMILADGDLSQLNFETLLAPANGKPGSKPHYWIDDVTLLAAPSLSMLAAAKSSPQNQRNLLMLGNAISADDNFPELPHAASEMQLIERQFNAPDTSIFSRRQANPSTYFASYPERYSYIHFVAHGVASRTDPLDSAIILSQGANPQDSYKLYARDIMQHPINARLVTISACYGSGVRAYAGEGLVGLSWAFLKAGAHNTIGAMWEASDDATPGLMDTLYKGLQQGQSPAAALRYAKLKLIHSDGIYQKPFYWAPFQIYTRL